MHRLKTLVSPFCCAAALLSVLPVVKTAPMMGHPRLRVSADPRIRKARAVLRQRRRTTRLVRNSQRVGRAVVRTTATDMARLPHHPWDSLRPTSQAVALKSEANILKDSVDLHRPLPQAGLQKFGANIS